MRVSLGHFPIEDWGGKKAELQPKLASFVRTESVGSLSELVSLIGRLNTEVENFVDDYPTALMNRLRYTITFDAGDSLDVPNTDNDIVVVLGTAFEIYANTDDSTEYVLSVAPRISGFSPYNNKVTKSFHFRVTKPQMVVPKAFARLFPKLYPYGGSQDFDLIVEVGDALTDIYLVGCSGKVNIKAKTDLIPNMRGGNNTAHINGIHVATSLAKEADVSIEIEDSALHSLRRGKCELRLSLEGVCKSMNVKIETNNDMPLPQQVNIYAPTGSGPLKNFTLDSGNNRIEVSDPNSGFFDFEGDTNIICGGDGSVVLDGLGKIDGKLTKVGLAPLIFANSPKNDKAELKEVVCEGICDFLHKADCTSLDLVSPNSEFLLSKMYAKRFDGADGVYAFGYAIGNPSISELTRAYKHAPNAYKIVDMLNRNGKPVHYFFNPFGDKHDVFFCNLVNAKFIKNVKNFVASKKAVHLTNEQLNPFDINTFSEVVSKAKVAFMVWGVK